MKKALIAALVTVALGAGAVTALADFGADSLAPGSQQAFTTTIGVTLVPGATPSDTSFVYYLRPDLSIGPIGAGLDLSVTTGAGGTSYTKSLRDSIRYLSVGHKDTSLVYARAGNIEGTSIGSGTLVDNYTNLTSNDYATGAKRLGTQFAVNTKYGGIETLNASASLFGGDPDPDRPGLGAWRAYVSPLPLIRIGYTEAYDSSKRVQDKLGVGASIAAQSVDAELRIGKGLLVPYGAVARFTDKGDGDASGLGYAAGLRSTWSLPGLEFAFKGEGRLFDSDFVPSAFDFGYETTKAVTGTGLLDRLLTPPGHRVMGVAGAASLYMPILGLGAYAELTDSRVLDGSAAVTALSPRVVAEASLDKLSLPVAGGRISADARYDATLGAGTDSLGELKAVATWRSPIGFTLAFINTYSYTKSGPTTRTYSVEGGWSF